MNIKLTSRCQKCGIPLPAGWALCFGCDEFPQLSQRSRETSQRAREIRLRARDRLHVPVIEKERKQIEREVTSNDLSIYSNFIKVLMANQHPGYKMNFAQQRMPRSV